MKPLNKEEIEKSITLWGAVPHDAVWVRESKLFQEGNNYATGIVSEGEINRRENIKAFLAKQGVSYQ